MLHNKGVRIAAIIVGVILSVVLVFFAFNVLQNVFSRASFEKPLNVPISDIASNSAKISWTTGVESSGAVVKYGTSPTTLSLFAPSDSDKTKDHSITLTLLSPNTAYYFVIVYGDGEDKLYDNAGVPWTFTTKSGSDEESSAPRPSPIQTLEIPDESESESAVLTCSETECSAIKDKIGKGCTSQDFIRCIKNPTGQPEQ